MYIYIYINNSNNRMTHSSVRISFQLLSVNSISSATFLCLAFNCPMDTDNNTIKKYLFTFIILKINENTFHIAENKINLFYYLFKFVLIWFH